MKYQLAVSLVLLISLSSTAQALSLKESFESALKTNMSDNINQSIINQNIQIKKQNQGNYLPKLSARGTYLKQDNVNVDQKTIGLNLSHSIYRGGRDQLAIEGSEKNIVIAENQKNVDRLALYQNVIQTYYNYFLNLNDYKNLELLTKQSQERVSETRKRVQVGRSRRGELLQAEAQLASAEAQLANGLGLVKESQERFFILTGLDKNKMTFDEKIEAPPEAASIENFLQMAYQRPDIKTRELRIDITELDLRSAKAAQYYPSLDLASNYYFNKRNSTSFRDSKWDIGLTLTFPLFEGGATAAKVRENVQRKEQATYALVDTKKTINLDIASRYETYHRFFDQIKAFDKALEKAKNSYDVALQDYRLGLISNLDVLSSLNIYLDSKRNSEKTKIQATMNYKLLEAASGVLP